MHKSHSQPISESSNKASSKGPIQAVLNGVREVETSLSDEITGDVIVDRIYAKFLNSDT